MTPRRQHLETAAVFGAAATLFGCCIAGEATRSEVWPYLGVLGMPLGAVVGVLVLVAARMAHPRAWRIRHGRCANCGYNLRASIASRCSECGADITRKVGHT